MVLARAMVAYLCRTLTTHSFPEIAVVIGRTNHSTVITAYKRFERQMAKGLTPAPQLLPAFEGMNYREISEAVAKLVAKAAY